VEFRVLGPLEIVDGDRPVSVSAPKQRALLLYLLMHAGTVVASDVILDALWPQEAPGAGVRTLRFHISKLRKALEPTVFGSGFSVIETHGTGYTVSADRHEIDARTFEARAATGRTELETRPDRAQRLIADALDMWRGRAYQDVMYEDFAATESHRLEELRLSAVESRIMAELRLGRSADLVGELEHLAVEFPHRERPTELLMRALYAAGRTVEAVAAGRALRDRLVEIGLEPQPSLTDLEDQILSHEVPLGPAAVAASQVPIGAALPTPITSFIGRIVELRQVKILLHSGRLVTLVGPPGSGKTRLGLEVAHDLNADLADGAVMVELSEVADAELVPQAVSTALGIPAPVGADYTQLIVSTLRDRQSLLMLDNCEHVIGNAASLVLSVLEACPSVKVLATSREALGVPGERVSPVPPFALPESDTQTIDQLLTVDSIRLFVDRAIELNAAFVVDDSNIEAVETICRRLDGIPLAIELAAGAVDALTAQQIADRLARSFVDVPSARRPALAHQATMEDAVRWSYNLLEALDRTVFARLSVFVGGFSMDAAETIGGWGTIDRSDVFDSVLRLVHKSLLMAITSPHEPVRYRMLTVLRQFGQRILRSRGESTETDRRHADYYATIAAAIEPHLLGPHEEAFRGLADLELDNFRYALESSLSGGSAETAMQITAALTWYWYWRSYLTEGLGWAHRALAAAPDPTSEAAAKVHYAVALFENVTGNYVAARDAFAAACDMAGLRGLQSLEAAALTGLGVSMRDQGRLGRASEYFDQAVAIDRSLPDLSHLALTLRMAASVSFMLGRTARARAEVEESYAIFSDLGHRGGMGWALETQSGIAFRYGEPGAFDLASRARRLYAEVHDRRNDAWVLLRIAEVHEWAGRLAEARAAIDESLAIFLELNDRRGSGYAVLRSGLAELTAGRGDAAGAQLRRAERLFEDLGDAGGAATAAGYLACLAIREGDIGGAVASAERWLAVPAAERHTWGCVDVMRELLAAMRHAGLDDAEIDARSRGYEAALNEGADMGAAGKTLDDIPTLLAVARPGDPGHQPPTRRRGDPLAG